jgi:DNA (cytosine-5)-methyltransferase 1
MSDQPTFFSLFAGIGGFDLGLERAGMKCIGQCEINPFCLRVLAKHWPDIFRHGDIRTLTGDIIRENCGMPDYLCGGFPCQDISNAGARAGIDGEQSGLYREFIRIIRELGCAAVMENVPALLGRGIGRILGDLAACGLDAEWDCIPAAAVGAPHLRDRIFIVAHPRSIQHEGSSDAQRRTWAQGLSKNISDADGLGRDQRQNIFRAWESSPSGIAFPHSHGQGKPQSKGPIEEIIGRSIHVPSAVPHADTQRLSIRQRERQNPGEKLAAAQGGGPVYDADGEHGGKNGRQAPREGGYASFANRGTGGIGRHFDWPVEPNVGRMAYGVPDRVDRLKGLGNAIVPQVAELVGRLIMRWRSMVLAGVGPGRNS